MCAVAVQQLCIKPICDFAASGLVAALSQIAIEMMTGPIVFDYLSMTVTGSPPLRSEAYLWC